MTGRDVSGLKGEPCANRPAAARADADIATMAPPTIFFSMRPPFRIQLQFFEFLIPSYQNLNNGRPYVSPGQGMPRGW